MEGHIYQSVGIECGTTPDGAEVVGIMFPTETSHIDDVYDVRFLTMAAAKALLIDLQEGLNACMEHKSSQ